MLYNRILVTGGAGMLGSALCERLVNEGHDVICMDSFYSSQKVFIERLLQRPNFELIRHDVTQPFLLEVDEIYNLACPASPVHYQRDPIQTVKTSFMGTLHALDLALRTGAKVLQASTSEVYGDPEISPQSEDYRGNVNTMGPRSCYDEGKRCAETLMYCYHFSHHVKIKVVRIFNTYGPGMHPYDGRVVSNLILQALAGEEMTLYGDGSQTRSFCYVQDLVDGLVRMMASEDAFTGPVNLGNPEELTIRGLAELIIELTGSSSKLVYRPLPMDDPLQRRPDIALAGEKLGWKPSVDLREGLTRTIAYFSDLDLTRFRHREMSII